MAGVVRRVSDSVPHAPIIPPITRAITAEAAMPRGIPQPMSPVEFCRQARRLRAVLENDPVRLHEELSQLNAAASAEEAAPARKSQVIDWTWMQSTKLGKHGVTLLGRLGRGLSMGAEDDSPGEVEMEDGHPRYTLVDPEDPLPIDEGYPTSVDRSFGQLVGRTLQAQRSGVLRYSQRLSLIREAGRRGIGRFEANLIIASVQHRLKIDNPPIPARKPLRLSGVLAFVLVQAMILWGFWRMWRS